MDATNGEFALEGAWRLETYVVKGVSTPVDGVLLFVAGRWATLYFVPRPQARRSNWRPDRASAEAGRYGVEDDRLTFHHQQAFQGGRARPLRMRRAADRLEVCRYRVEADRLSIHFPSGNTLHARRLEA